MKKPILVVMAAGMGSRYGGLKQIDPVGNRGEAILDFSLFDAYEAGFETAVIIIKEAIQKEFMQTVGRRLEKCPLEIRYVYQELENLPKGYRVPVGRTKPWGTGHAVLCAAQAVDGAPFAVINADDYYGKTAFQVIFDFLSSAEDDDHYHYCMVGYELGKTVTDSGSVARGLCETDPDGFLSAITEHTRIEKYSDGIHYTEDGGSTWTDVAANTIVSMNMWGFTPSFLDETIRRFPLFLDRIDQADPGRCEYFLPSVVSDLLNENKATVKVLHSPDRWYGVTYAADKPVVVDSLRKLTVQGKYPTSGLWQK